MPFKSIKKTKTYGDYQNVTLEYELEPGETIESAEAKLDEAIIKIIGMESEVKSLTQEVLRLTVEKESLERYVENSKAKAERVREWMKAHGLKESFYEELPF